MSPLVTVAIPVKDGGALLERTLQAVGVQEVAADVQLLVCDSGSSDGSVALARSYGAEVIEIEPAQFSHGATRNLLMERSAGRYVAFLTQDAAPASEYWLARLIEGFALADDVGLVFGPYKPNANASPMVARELTAWFRSFSPDGTPRIDRLEQAELALPVRELLGPRGFFTDANGMVARAAWEQVPFRPVRYAEDHALALDMLRAGFAKVYLPDAAVLHSHEYTALGWLRRSFDENRALHDLYGYVEPLSVSKLRGLVGADFRWAREQGRRPEPLRSLVHHGARLAGAVLGTRYRALSLGRAR